MGPLHGVKVLELAQIMAGPTCGLMLADLGADVIKVERVPGGDDTRAMNRPSVNGESAAFMAMNRNKRGIALNLKIPAAQEALKRMATRADVVTENYRKGTMEKLGLGYAALKAVNPRLIYCSISGYGRTGPYADKGGYDLIAQGMSGLMSITGEPGRAPAKSGAPVCDINAGVLAALGIVAAYVHRLKTGEGQLVDTSLYRSRHPADLLAVGDLFRHRHGAGARGLGASSFSALPGIPRGRWLAHHRRGEPGELGANGARARRSRMAGGRALPQQCAPDEQPAGAHRAHECAPQDAHRARVDPGARG